MRLSPALVVLVSSIAAVFAEPPSAAVHTTSVSEKSDEPGFSVQTGYEGYLVPSGSEDSTTGAGSIAAFASSLFNGGDPAAAIASLLGGQIETDRKGEVGETHKIKLIGAHGKPVVIPLPGFLSKHDHKFPKHSKFEKIKSLIKSPKKALLVKIIVKAVLGLLAVAFISLLIGGIAAAICTFTPLCHISLLQQNARSLMSSDYFTQTSQFVLDAIETYQELQN